MLFLRTVREWRLHQNNKPAPKQWKNWCKSYLTSKQCKHIFLQFSHLISRKTLQNNSSASNSSGKVRPKKSIKSSASSFEQAVNQQESDRVASWENDFSLSGKDLPLTNLIFFISLWPEFNNAINVFQSLPSLTETSIFPRRSLVRQGSIASWPLVHIDEKLPVAVIKDLVGVCHTHSVNKLFFRIGKV